MYVLERYPIVSGSNVKQIITNIGSIKGAATSIFTIVFLFQIEGLKLMYNSSISFVSYIKDTIITIIKWIYEKEKANQDNNLFDKLKPIGKAAIALIFAYFTGTRTASWIFNGLTSILNIVTAWGKDELSIMVGIVECLLYVKMMIYVSSIWCKILLRVTGQLDKCEYYQKSTAKTTEEKKKNLHRAMLDSLVELKF